MPRGSAAPQLEKVSFGELIQIKHQDTLPLIHDGETGFSAAQLTYTVTVPDASGSFYVWADPATGTTCKLLYQAIFDTKPGVQRQERHRLAVRRSRLPFSAETSTAIR